MLTKGLANVEEKPAFISAAVVIADYVGFFCFLVFGFFFSLSTETIRGKRSWVCLGINNKGKS
jgi:hypothetical protein